MTVSTISPKTADKSIVVPNDLYNLEEAAKYLRVSPTTFWHIRKSAKLQITYINKRKYFHRDVLDAYLGHDVKTLVPMKKIIDELNDRESIILFQLIEQNKISGHVRNKQLMFDPVVVRAAIEKEVANV